MGKKDVIHAEYDNDDKKLVISMEFGDVKGNMEADCSKHREGVLTSSAVRLIADAFSNMCGMSPVPPIMPVPYAPTGMDWMNDPSKLDLLTDIIDENELTFEQVRDALQALAKN